MLAAYAQSERFLHPSAKVPVQPKSLPRHVRVASPPKPRHSKPRLPVHRLGQGEGEGEGEGEGGWGGGGDAERVSQGRKDARKKASLGSASWQRPGAPKLEQRGGAVPQRGGQGRFRRPAAFRHVRNLRRLRIGRLLAPELEKNAIKIFWFLELS